VNKEVGVGVSFILCALALFLGPVHTKKQKLDGSRNMSASTERSPSVASNLWIKRPRKQRNAVNVVHFLGLIHRTQIKEKEKKEETASI
jgi:hypothetical protein